MKVDARDAGVRRPERIARRPPSGQFPPVVVAKARAGGHHSAAAGVHRRSGSENRLLDQGHANLAAHAKTAAGAVARPGITISSISSGRVSEGDSPQLVLFQVPY